MTRSSRARLATLAILPLAALVTALPASAATSWQADLRVDADRNGVLTAADETVKDSATALMLPNLDDDSRRCPARVAGRPDRLLNACHDANDKIVNGSDDVADLAPIQTMAMADVPADATGTLTLDSTRVRLFQQGDNGAWRAVTAKTRLTAARLRTGVRLGLEAKDINRDAARWNGQAKVTLTVTSGATTSNDTVTLSVAPLLSQTHLQRADMMLAPGPAKVGKDTAMLRFNAGLRRVAARAGVAGGVKVMPTDEAWQQDYVEPMYVSMPTASGTHAIRLLLRSHQDRPTSRALYTLRGKDVGVVWLGKATGYSTLNSMGNFETIPPFAHAGKTYAAGRIILGRDEEKDGDHGRLSKQMRTMLAAQGGVTGGIQKPLLLNTGWLGVGHVDEFVSFAPADTPLGWKLLVADPMAAIGLLHDAKAAGKGGAHIDARTKNTDGFNLTVNEALRPGRKGLVKANKFAAGRIEANVARIKAATGLTDADVVGIPVLYYSSYSSGESNSNQVSAYVPGAINSPIINGWVAAPKQFSLRVKGRDLFADAVTAAYAKAGLRVGWVDDFYSHHNGGGEVHCGSNTLRDMTQQWW